MERSKAIVISVSLLLILFVFQGCDKDSEDFQPDEWPSATNTGVQAGIELTVSEGFTVDEEGSIVENLEITGVLNIKASNVIVKNCKIRQGIFFRSYEGYTNLLIEDCEIGPDNGVGGDNGVVFSDYTMRRCNIHNFYDGAKMNGNVLIEDCYIHDMYLDNGAHIDGLQNVGGKGDVIIRHNNIDARPFNVSNDNGNAAIFSADFPEGTITVENNLLAGGHYTLQMLDNATYVVRGNRFVADTYTYGTHRFTCRECITWQDNSFLDGDEIEL